MRLIRPVTAAALTAASALSTGCGAPGAPALVPSDALPLTRAEASGFTETSTHADVLAFIDSLVALGADVEVGSIGTTNEGRTLPYVVASRPLFGTPEAARRSGRPIVYVQGNIHGGEVEGKDALQALLRDLVFDPAPNALDSIVLIAVPIYNADGNERFGPVERQRSEQNGPARVGLRPNAQGLDLNRDYMKAEAPETRGSLRMFNDWAPDVFVDLHTTNGSYHGYALTYAPSLVPAPEDPPRGSWAAANALTRDELLPELRQRMRDRHGFEVFDYGNFALRYGADVNTDSLREAWYSYDHRPRFGTNYYGLRGGVSILSEAFSHDPFERRVRSTYAFVSEILSMTGERAGSLMEATRGTGAMQGQRVPVRSRLTRTPYEGDVLAEILEEDPDSVPEELGVHRGIRRTGRYRTLRMPVYDRFDPVLEREVPRAYAVPAELTEVLEVLRTHGVTMEALPAARRVEVEAFTIDSVARSERPFQAHNETLLAGRWTVAQREIPAGWFIVPGDQRLAAVAVYLLEPESDDGVVAWCCPAVTEPWARDFFPQGLEVGREYPILRLR